MAGPTARGGFIFIWAFLLGLFTLCSAQKPEHSISSFDNLPARLFFLDDTLNDIYHDALEGNVLVSNDEGKTWTAAEDGTTHYRTYDRTKTWRSFEKPSPPALTARPLSFHSDPKKYGYILFQGSDGEGSGQFPMYESVDTRIHRPERGYWLLPPLWLAYLVLQRLRVFQTPNPLHCPFWLPLVDRASIAAFPPGVQPVRCLPRPPISKQEFRLIGHDEVLKSYDHIITAGALAGLVLALRLSEDANTNALVLEAGTSGDERERDIDTPAGTYYASIVGSDLDWRYATVNQPRLNNRDIYWPRGKVLGGSTAMNAMYVVRPAATELDAWAELMASDPETASHADLWNWDNMFEMMKKSENYSSPPPESWAIGKNFAISPEDHGRGGPMQLGYPGVVIDAVGNWTAACDRAGVSPLEEPNGGVTLGGFITPNYISQSNWTRSYSRSTYIDSLPPRDNLHIVTEATVTKLGFADGDRVTVGGEEDLTISNRVEFVNATAGDMATRYVVGINKEVILSAGPMGSPKIVMHSGVGPKDVLDQLGVRIHLELPGIGQHLQDHLTAGVTWQSRRETAGDLRATAETLLNLPSSSRSSTAPSHSQRFLRLPLRVCCPSGRHHFWSRRNRPEVFNNESYTVPANAKVNDSDLGPQGGGSFTADTGGAKALGVTGDVAAAIAIAALGAALML
ncbi:GMC oxidoreductase-domain-containing protein [Coprinopsis sp. MPI-PUGE-AT-0042]|nr:GMC oxidoreductase-domain-containing protein [Coprinopsis sp. MPI-PUGE-AT-0042]